MTSARGSLSATTIDLRGLGTRSYVVIMSDPSRGLRRVTVAGTIEIGRSQRPGMIGVAHPSVSRRHAVLQITRTGLAITDLGSMNGTLVNGVPLTGSAALALGDVIRFGNVAMVVLSERFGSQTQVAVPPPADPNWTRTLAGAAAAGPPTTAVPLPMPSVRQAPTKEPKEPARPFPNYLQLRRVVPIWLWHVVRVLTVSTLVGLCALLVVRPATGLYVMWRVIAPVLPLLLILGPGLWRNACPLAAGNQLPRLLRFTRAVKPPSWLKQHGYLVAVIGFLGIVSSRRVVFDHNGPATAAVLGGALFVAFVGGTIFAGKSGWCSSICPLFPVQRLYGQTPFVTSPNSHCRPCVGCAKNCYDFNPKVAYQADMHDDDPRWTAPRKFFAGCFPGVVVGYWTVTDTRPGILYLTFFAYVLVSAGSFFAIEALVPWLTASRLAVVYGATALSTFYWFGAPGVAGVVQDLSARPVPWLVLPLRATVIVLALIWVLRTFGVERRFIRYSIQAQPIQLPADTAARLLGGSSGSSSSSSEPEVTFQPQDRRVVTSAGTSLLDIAEKDGLPIEAGCRMGMCGADPVAILAGAENLSPCGDDEADTLRRLGLGEGVRLACCARVSGPVTVSLDPSAAPKSKAPPAVPEPRRPVDRSICSVVVLGNGIAGVTAAEEIRRGHPDCEIHVVGREVHPLYNRMGIGRLVYGRSALAGMFLLAEDWYGTRDITCWLNTRATAIDLAGQRVSLGTGETLPFDRLIVATGGRSSVPRVPGVGLPGSFVLREAADAFAIRGYVQEHGANTAAVLGGGPLGIEAAHALAELGLAVQLLHRGDQLLRQYIDRQCAIRLGEYLRGRGISLVPNADIAGLVGRDRVRGVALATGDPVPVDLALMCTGLVSNTELAAAAGIAVRRGIVVDRRMRTNVPGVFAAGDVAELDGETPGLWPTAVAQGRVAGRSALGENEEVRPKPTPMLVKGIGIHLVSAGRIESGPGDEVLVRDRPDQHVYTRLVTTGGRVAGAVILGTPDEAPALLAAVEQGSPVRELAPVRSGAFVPSG